jgi:predicted transcriptional regulator
MRVVTVKLPEDLDERLVKTAARSGVSKSSLVREALAAYLGEPVEEGAEPTVFELVRDAVGRVAGPGLAATDPERMKGYGR